MYHLRLRRLSLPNEDDPFPNSSIEFYLGSIFIIFTHWEQNEITLNAIRRYLTQRPQTYAIYKTNKGTNIYEQISLNKVDRNL